MKAIWMYAQGGDYDSDYHHLRVIKGSSWGSFNRFWGPETFDPRMVQYGPEIELGVPGGSIVMRFRLGIGRVPGLIWLENRFYPNFVPGLAGMFFFDFWGMEKAEVDQIEFWLMISRCREYGLFENDLQMTSNDLKWPQK